MTIEHDHERAETWVRLEDVPDYLPTHRSGRRAHRSIGYRWAKRGAFGVRLRTISFGRLQVTKPEWIAEFAAAIAEARKLCDSEVRHRSGAGCSSGTSAQKPRTRRATATQVLPAGDRSDR